MKKLFLVSLFLLFIFSLHAEYSDFYFQWAGFFYPNLDPNAGLTLFPSLFIPMGGRYEGMGTAFTAVADDASYIESNPAASSTLGKTELVFLHHSWIMDSNVEGVVFTTRIDNLGIGAAGKFLYVPFNAKDEWGRAGGSGYYIEGIGTFNISYNFLPSYYFFGLAVGTNLKFAYMGVPSSIYPNQTVVTAMADVGLLTRFNFLKFYSSNDYNFSLGATFKNYSPLVTPDPLPTLASFGIAYSPFRPLEIAVDFNLPVSFDPLIPAERYYFSGGFSLTFSQFISVQGGVKFKGGNPMVSLGANIDLATVSFDVNYNLDLTNSLDPLDKFSVSARFNLGDAGRGAQKSSAESLYLDGIDLYSKGDFEGAIAKWQQVLALDTTFTPARDYIEIAKKAIQMKKEIIDKQKFN